MHIMPILLLRHELVEQTAVGKNLKTTDIQFLKIYCVFKGNCKELYHMQEKGKPMDRKIVNNVFII